MGIVTHLLSFASLFHFQRQGLLSWLQLIPNRKPHLIFNQVCWLLDQFNLMLFRELTKTLGNQLMASMDIQETDSIVFGAPPLCPKIKLVPESLPPSIPCYCEIENTPSCNICFGTKRIPQNGNFFKFLSAVIDYKIGKSQNFQEKSKPLGEIKLAQVEVKTKMVFNDEIVTTRNVAMSLQMDYNKQSSILEEARLACSAPVVVHKGVECDGCGAYPLIGTRFQCSHCDSYDLCAFCYGKKGSEHEHSFRRVDFPKSEMRKKVLKQQFKKMRVSQRTIQ